MLTENITMYDARCSSTNCLISGNVRCSPILTHNVDFDYDKIPSLKNP